MLVIPTNIETATTKIRQFDEQAEKRFIAVVERAIEKSFVTRPLHRRTDREAKRRVDLCSEVIRRAIANDIPLDRILDCMYGCLIALIDKQEVEFGREGEMWVVPDSGIIHSIPRDEFERQENAVNCTLASDDAEERLIAAAEGL